MGRILGKSSIKYLECLRPRRDTRLKPGHVCESGLNKCDCGSQLACTSSCYLFVFPWPGWAGLRVYELCAFVGKAMSTFAQ